MLSDKGRPLSPKEFIPLDRGGTKEMDAKEGGGGRIRRDRQAIRDDNNNSNNRNSP